MPHYDVFNGDADGICGLHQLRLHTPQESTLITGAKREIKLLQRIQEVHDSSITVLDISLNSNQDALKKLLNQNNSILYFDHHFAGDIPDSPRLTAYIDTEPSVCTSILVDQYLEGKFRPWAVAAAFGDNLHASAFRLAKSLQVNESQLAQLKELGELINYNGYGLIEDLHFAPDSLYQALAPYVDPWAFCETSEILKQLQEGFAQDMKNALAQAPVHSTAAGKVYYFPAEKWSKRVAGVFSNQRARDEPQIAHALLVENGDGTYLISVRSPLERPQGADKLCLQFQTGGGRAAAAGINDLPESELSTFLDQFNRQFGQGESS